MELISALKKRLNEYRDNKLSLRESIVEKKAISKSLTKEVKLTEEEKKLIERKWKNVVTCPIKEGFTYYEALKNIRGFSENYLPHAFYYPYVERILNPERYKRLLGHKSLTDIIYNGICRHPITVLRSVGGVLLDKNYKPVLLKEAIEILKKEERDLLLKPAHYSVQGKGISLIQKDDIDTLIKKIEDNQSLIENSDFVLQERVSQSEDTSLFNPSSLNCIRITTLNLNSKITICSRALKCGPKDSVVDNIGKGKRGVIVGIDEKGYLEDFGFYGNGERAYEHNGIVFSGKQIQHFSKVVNTCQILHSLTSSCKIIGWDMALDEDDNPVLIEGNTVFPGISFEQMCSGPIFGDRTDEVIEYISHFK